MIRPSSSVLQTLKDLRVACLIGTVWVGAVADDPLPKREPCAADIAAAGYGVVRALGVVSTSACGEAVLDTGCGLLHVFLRTRLVLSTCDGRSFDAGNACLVEGTLAFDETCSRPDVYPVTPSASLSLEGTWASLTYVPDGAVTLAVVLDGSASARPVVDGSGGTGEAVTIEAGQFWFSSPGLSAPDIAGLASREAHPISDLPPVVAALGLEATFAAVGAQARLDRAPVELPAIPVTAIRAAGNHLEQAGLAEATFDAIDWPPITEVGGGVPIVGLPSTAAVPITLPPRITDRTAPLVLLKEAGVLDREVVVVVEKSDVAANVGYAFAGQLESIGFVPRVLESAPADAIATFDEEIARENAVFLVASR